MFHREWLGTRASSLMRFVFSFGASMLLGCFSGTTNNKMNYDLSRLADDISEPAIKSATLIKTESEDSYCTSFVFTMPREWKPSACQENTRVPSGSTIESLKRRTGYTFHAPAGTAAHYSYRTASAKAAEFYVVEDVNLVIVDCTVFH
ncbi:MAG TPA: hypothetical protein VGE74_15655 [Gemmata sp.]